MKKIENRKIVVNDKFSIERDKTNWIVYERRMTCNRNGEEIEVIDSLYYGSLKHACAAILDRMAGDCKTLEDIPNLFDRAVESLTKQTSLLF